MKPLDSSVTLDAKYKRRNAWSKARQSLDYQAIYEQSRGICQLCNLPMESERFEIDHIVPIARGGSDLIGNLRAVHAECNSKRYDSDTMPGSVQCKRCGFSWTPRVNHLEHGKLPASCPRCKSYTWNR